MRRLAAGLTAGLAIAALGMLGTAGSEVAAAVGGPVSTTAASWTPQLATGDSDGTVEQVRQIVQCGSTMYAVGRFTQVRKGTTILTRNNAFSFSATNGVITAWDPNVNGQVDTVAFAGADCSNAYLGGTFSSVRGTVVKNIAKVSTTGAGSVDTAFLNSAGGRVAHMEVMQGHLLVGGNFPGFLKSVSPATGRTDGYGTPVISGNYVFPGVKSNSTRIYNMTPSPDGTAVLMMGVFTSVGGQPRKQIFRLNLTPGAATVSPWYSPQFNGDCATTEPFYLQDAAWSPDMAKIYVATTGYKPYNKLISDPRTGLCDAAAAFSATQTGSLSWLWINYTGCDSLFSVAADANTVYIGGHERWASNPLGCDRAGPGAVAAPGMAGLSPVNGSVVWNPTRGRGLGADDMLVTSAGLWVSSDNQANTSQCAKAYGHTGICFLPY
ncbi:MAG: hypothetical protein ACJ73E_03530 [Mycobacteriales bacterium]